MFDEMKAMNQERKDAQYISDRHWYMYGKDCADKELTLEDCIKDITDERNLDRFMMGWNYGKL